MDGKLSKEEFDKAFNMALEGCRKIRTLQNDALKRKYKLESDTEKFKDTKEEAK
jgi:exosome complex component RRP41